MDNGNERGDSAHPDPVPIRVERAPESGYVIVRFLGRVRSIWEHWRGHRSYACTGDATCDPRLHRESTVWRGFAAAEWMDTRRGTTWVPCVFEISIGLAHYITDDDLRGQVWRVQRFKVSKWREEIRGTFLRTDDPRKLRSDIDVEAAVKRVTRCLWVEFDRPKPHGVRQALQPTDATVEKVNGHTADPAATNDLANRMLHQALRDTGQAPKPHANGKRPKNDE